MAFGREHLGHGGVFGGSAEGATPGKRTRTERLPASSGGAGAEASAGAASDAGEHGGSAADDPMWMLGGGGGGGGGGNIDPAALGALYYGINPPRHAEKAYQPGDPQPPLHPRPTTVGKSGVIVALATTIYNRPPFGRVARFSLCDRGGGVLHACAVATPSKLEIPGFPPGSEVYIRPETMGTMVKLLTPEQIAGGAEEEAEAGGGGGGGAIDPGTMHALYYGINPPRHAEKAYQAGDPAPPLHPRPTTAGKSGVIVALATTIYNRPPFGKLARFSLCDRGGRVLHSGAVRTPGRLEFGGFAPGTPVYIRPETMGTMVKLLTPEQIAGAADDHDS